MDKKEFLELFCDKAKGRVAFKLLNGEEYEGYILVKEFTFLFSDPNPFSYPNDLEETEFKIEEIDIKSFYYYDKEWINFKV